jgi:hypothetical protein
MDHEAFLAEQADRDNDATWLAATRPAAIQVPRFNAAQTRHYFRICQMYSSCRTPIARNSMRRLYKAAGIKVPSFIAVELDENVDGPVVTRLAIRTPVAQLSPLMRRQAS